MSSHPEKKEQIRGLVLEKEPMSKHTSWAVGGVADRMFKPVDIDDLALFLSTLDESEPLFWLGLGSNLLVRDGGIRGTVILTAGLLNTLKTTGSNSIRAGAGVACAKVSKFAGKHSLSGAEFLAGIPGTMGGALAMNAGAFGGETWPIVDFVEVINRRGERRVREASDYEVSYRSVNTFEGEWFVAAHLRLEPDDSESGIARIRDLLGKRAETQPTGERSCGSVFRNPENDFAARLIEEAGLKGFSIGGAQVSEKHANFIINNGTATANEIETLIQHVRDTVNKTHGVLLETEVHIIGEPL